LSLNGAKKHPRYYPIQHRLVYFNVSRNATKLVNFITFGDKNYVKYRLGDWSREKWQQAAEIGGLLP